MSDRFKDSRTYIKLSTDTAKIEAAKAHKRYSDIYYQYAKVVKVNKVDDDFKRIVDDFKECFTYSPGTRPTGLVKKQWIDYYSKNH